MPFRTERFEIHETAVSGAAEQGECVRTFHAWRIFEDVPKPICTVTLWGDYVEWIHVDEQHRRQGVATEVLREISRRFGPLVLDSGSSEGKQFLCAYGRDSANRDIVTP